MSSQRRPRACDNCQTLKIRCEGITNGQPCQRCARLSKECLPSAPKRQRDRVAELEAKVDALTRLLQAQGIADVPLDGENKEAPEDRIDSVRTTPSAASNNAPTINVASKKRRHDAVAKDIPGRTESPHHDTPSTAGFSLDALISLDQQSRLLRHYVSDIARHFPAVPVSGEISLVTMRQRSPALLRAILFAASPGSFSVDDQEEMATIILNEMANKAVFMGEKSIELVQAIAIVCLWYRAPKHHTSLAVYQLTQLACGIATGIGLGGPQSSPSLELVISGDDIDTPDAWRTWLVCYTLSTSMATLLRRTNTQAWTNYHQQCVTLLQTSVQALQSDRLFCQMVLAERLCDQITTELAHSNLDAASDLRDLTSRTQALQARISEWSAQIPTDLRRPNLLIWQHAMSLYLHEPVLHTNTNKQLFAGPFMAVRISTTDFPTPAITADHVKSLYALRDAAHALLDTFCLLGPPSIMVALPTIHYSARALYAIYILATLYVAVTATGHTYGIVLAADDLKFELYICKLMNLSEELNKFDASAGPARLVGSFIHMSRWFENYKSSLACAAAPDPAPEDVATHEHDALVLVPGDFDDTWLGDLFADIDWSSSVPLPDRDDAHS